MIEQTLRVIRIYRTEEVTTNPAKMKRSSQRVRDTAVHLDTGGQWKRLFQGQCGDRLS